MNHSFVPLIWVVFIVFIESNSGALASDILVAANIGKERSEYATEG